MCCGVAALVKLGVDVLTRNKFHCEHVVPDIYSPHLKFVLMLTRNFRSESDYWKRYFAHYLLIFEPHGFLQFFACHDNIWR